MAFLIYSHFNILSCELLKYSQPIDSLDAQFQHLSAKRSAFLQGNTPPDNSVACRSIASHFKSTQFIGGAFFDYQDDSGSRWISFLFTFIPTEGGFHKSTAVILLEYAGLSRIAGLYIERLLS